jgi:Lactate dehydrogenase and related dehydrogenases
MVRVINCRFFEPHLNEETVGLATGFEGGCVFVNDHVDGAVIARLRSLGVRLIALRCAGYNNVDLAAAKKHGITVVRVPAYSPYAVAEHTIALMLALNRKLHRAYNRVREGNFALTAWSGSTCTAKRRRDRHGTNRDCGGANSHRIRLSDFGVRSISKCTCRSLGVRYVELNELFAQSDIISLHCPLTPENKPSLLVTPPSPE